MTKKVKEVIKMLEDAGWEHTRTKGDHRCYEKAGAKRPIVIPGHLNADMPIGTYKNILREIKEGI